MHNCPGGPPASENLQSRARCHTEQKFAHDLIQSGQRYRGQDFTLSGELPPCPNCHRALQHAADRSGANIQYQWTGPDGRPQTLTYRPNTPPRGNGTQAESLCSADGRTGAYRMDPDADRRNGYRFRDHSTASSTYTRLSGELADEDD